MATELRDAEVTVVLSPLGAGNTTITVSAHRNVGPRDDVVTDEVGGGSRASNRRVVSIMASVTSNDPMLAAETADWLRDLLGHWRSG
jgi:hypothetical protein